jgi:predicted DNA-binding protein
MTQPQIVLRIPLNLLEKLNNCIEQTGTSKTEVVVSALVHYLRCVDNLLLNKRVAALEANMTTLETLIKAN